MHARETILRSIIRKIANYPIDKAALRSFEIPEHQMFDEVMRESLPRPDDLGPDAIDQLWFTALDAAKEHQAKAADELEALLIVEERKAGERSQAAATSAAYLHGFLAAAREAVELCAARARPFDKSMSLRMEAKKCAEMVLWNLIETIECPTCGGAIGNLKCLCKGTGRVSKLGEGKRLALKKRLDAELAAIFDGDPRVSEPDKPIRSANGNQCCPSCGAIGECDCPQRDDPYGVFDWSD